MKKIFSFTLISFVLISIFSASIVFARVYQIDYEGVVSKKKLSGYILYKKSDGTEIKKYKDREVAIFKDGTQLERNTKKGITEVKYNDGKKLIIDLPKGTRSYISKDGTKKVLDLKGKTPYGDSIIELKKGIQMQPVPVYLKFDPMYSDDMLEGDLKIVYNELYDSLRKRVTANRYKGKELSIIMSYCRHGQYGYCYKKSNTLSIIFMNGSRKKKEFKANSLIFNDIKKRKEFANTIYKYFSSI